MSKRLPAMVVRFRARALPLVALLLVTWSPLDRSGQSTAAQPFYGSGASGTRTPRATLLGRVSRILRQDAPRLSVEAHHTIRDEVVETALDLDMDPLLILALMRVESRFDPGAISYKGAVGLLQVMPSTARWFANHFGDPADADALLEPGRNIRLGAGYLAFLRGRYGCLARSLHAYNRGPTALDSQHWSPSAVQRGYAALVLSVYERYRRIGGDRS